MAITGMMPHESGGFVATTDDGRSLLMPPTPEVQRIAQGFATQAMPNAGPDMRMAMNGAGGAGNAPDMGGAGGASGATVNAADMTGGASGATPSPEQIAAQPQPVAVPPQQPVQLAVQSGQGNMQAGGQQDNGILDAVQQARLAMLTRPAGRAVTIPAGFRDAGGERTILSPNARAAQDQALSFQSQAELKKTQLAQDQAEKELEAYDAQLLSMQKIQEREAQLDRQRQTEISLFQEDMKARIDDIEKTKIDPNRWMAEKDTAGKITAGLAVAFGALGSAFTGGPNIGLQMVNNSIERDIDAQRSAFDAKRTGLAARNTLYGQMMAKYQDDRLATAAAKATMFEAAAIKAKRLAAETNVAQPRALETAAKLSAMAAENYKQGEGVIVQRYVPAQTVIAGGAPMSNKERAERLNELEKGELARQELAQKGGKNDLYVPGYGNALSPEDAKDARASVAATNSVIGSIDRIRKFTESIGDRVTPAKRAEVKSMKNSLMLQIKNLEKAGALDKGMQEIAEDMIGEPEALLDFGGRTGGLSAIQAYAVNSLNNRMQAYGVAPAQQAVVNGRVQTQLTGAPPLTPKSNQTNTSFKGAGK